MNFCEEMTFLCYLLIKDKEIEIKCISEWLLLKDIRTPFSKAEPEYKDCITET